MTSHYARWWCLYCAISAHLPAHTKFIVWSVLVASDSFTVNETMAFFSRFLRTNLCEGKYLLSLFTVHSWMMGAYGKEKSDIWRYCMFEQRSIPSIEYESMRICPVKIARMTSKQCSSKTWWRRWGRGCNWCTHSTPSGYLHCTDISGARRLAKCSENENCLFYATFKTWGIWALEQFSDILLIFKNNRNDDFFTCLIGANFKKINTVAALAK